MVPTVTLFAEDLTRGWRVDVRDQGEELHPSNGVWRSLHCRIGVFTFPARPGPPLTITEEGMLQPAPAQVVAIGGNVGPETYIHEGLFQWRGYSLAAHRPGKAISRSDGPQVIANPAQPGGVSLSVNFAVEPGTLPRLRFGRVYQFRMRAVDLAGNSLAIEEADAALATLGKLGIVPLQQLVYKRFEPVAAPVIVPKSKFAEGELIAVLVIRSNRGVTTEQYATSLNQLAGGVSPIIYSGVSERHLAPAKTSQFMAERSGLFDVSFGTGTQAAQTYALAAREKGSLIDNFTYDASGNRVDLPPQTLETVTTSDNNAPIEGEPSAKNPPRGYVIHTETKLQPTYLPDPLSRGASLFDLPGAPPNTVATLDSSGALGAPQPLTIAGRASLTKIDFGPPELWPNVRPFRLQLKEDTATPTLPGWSSDQRILSVSLPQARIARVKLSSFLGSEDEADLLGVWEWLVKDGWVSATPGSLDLATAGALWMLTPTRDIILVHAVQQPLGELTLNLTAPRDTGSTFTYLGGTARIDGASTAKLDLIASWTEQLDGPGLTSNTSAHIFEFPIHLPDEAGEAGPQLSLSASGGPVGMTVTANGSGFTAGEGIKVTFDISQVDAQTANATGSFRSTFAVPNVQTGQHQVVATGQTSGAKTLATFTIGLAPIATYDAAGDTVTFQAPPADNQSGKTTFLSRHEFGDTKHRQVTYKLVATSRFREYFPPQVSDFTIAAETRVNVRSSVRPPAPGVLYALPVFEWTRTTNSDGSQSRIRKASGIRVYLSRPWYVSGEGEQLAVVLAEPDPANYPPDESLAPYVTQWGPDPIWSANDQQTGHVLGPPFPENFGGGHVGRGYSLEELVGSPQITVLIAAHDVEFDKDRALWYCDIPVDPGQVYCPFVRLALARFQPNSILDRELSRVVLSDFVQVLPQRTVSVQPVAGDPNSFTIVVEGLTYQGSAWDPTAFECIDLSTGFPASIDNVSEPDPPPRSAPVPNLIQVALEQRIIGTQDEAGWEPVGGVNATSAVRADQPNGAPLWNGRVSLPGTRLAGRFRVVIREYEQLPIDAHYTVPVKLSFDGNPEHIPPIPPRDDHGVVIFASGAPAAATPSPGRMVFAETIEL